MCTRRSPHDTGLFPSEICEREAVAEISVSQWFNAANNDNKPGAPDGTGLSHGSIWLEERAERWKRKGQNLEGGRTNYWLNSPADGGDVLLSAQRCASTNICHAELVTCLIRLLLQQMDTLSTEETLSVRLSLTLFSGKRHLDRDQKHFFANLFLFLVAVSS